MKKFLLTLSIGATFGFIACSESSSAAPSTEEELSSFVDSRDGHSYKKVTIGDQTWMAENLEYKKDFYTWKEANDACPEGWHLPNDEDWKKLFDEVGGADSAGAKLKANSGWGVNRNGTNLYGFAVSADGYYNDADKIEKKGITALFWSSTELDSENAYNWRFDGVSDFVFHEDNAKNFKLSVRCIEGSLPSSSDTLSTEKSSSSSSRVRLSSSSVVYKASVYDDAKHTLTDGRDGHVYKTVTINNRVWMAENLNFKYYYKSAQSFCYLNDEANCSKYGRYYNAGAALDSAKAFSDYSWECAMNKKCDGSFVRGACPDGWHIPSMYDWNELLYTVDATKAGKKLKSKQGWNGNETTDDYGFSVLPAGAKLDEGGFINEGTDAYFWTPAKSESVAFDTTDKYIFSTYTGFRSIRCIKDYTDENEIPKPDHEFVYGTLKDSRDGRTYKTIEIGNQVWMAENLKIPYLEDTTLSSCYDGKAENCEIYGRLYLWSAAIDSAMVYSEDGAGCGYRSDCLLPHIVKGVCPDGWRLPGESDWIVLRQYAGGKSVAGQKLKATQGWKNNGNGYDLYGFNALPFAPDSARVFYWGHGYVSNSPITESAAVMNSNTMQLYVSTELKSEQGYVRCIKSTSADSNYTGMYIKDESTYDSVANTLTDFRDNKVYKTVKIGEQVWMAENLNFNYEWGRAHSSCKSYTTEDNKECKRYGRLYGFLAAVDSVGIFSEDAKGCGFSECQMKEKARGVCPRGWHLPSNDEWDVLIQAAGGKFVGGLNLKSTETWPESKPGKDLLGFGALRSGCAGVYSNTTCNMSSSTYFFGSTVTDGSVGCIRLSVSDDKVDLFDDKISVLLSGYQYAVRCIKDDE